MSTSKPRGREVLPELRRSTAGRGHPHVRPGGGRGGDRGGDGSSSGRAGARSGPPGGEAGPQRGFELPDRQGRHHRRPPPRERHLPGRRHGVAAPRGDPAPRPPLLPPRQRQPQRDLREPAARRRERTRLRGRAADRQVQAGLLRGGVMAMATRTYMSIGEVLLALKTEFPDITISKIRFLEGEGLIEPERTASGYRKFYEQDVERLRQILKLQRDEYLPLKVIRERLARREAEGEGAQEPKVRESDEELAEPAVGLQMSIEEMASSTGVDRERIRELEKYGLLMRSRMRSRSPYYDGDDYIVLSIVKDFFRYGVEPRHLTMYQHFSQREASLFEAIILPMLRQRNPDARKTAVGSLGDLSRASRKLKQALLRNNLRQHLTSP